MVEAVEGDLGRQFTSGAKVPGVTTAGKSGTAELGGRGEPHSWFIGFAPADAPTIAIAVIVEQAGRRRRPLIERIGLAAVAAVMAALFGGVAAAAWLGGEGFLAVMGATGCLMTAWVGALTLFRG